ncbi:MAG TPA: DUF2807 domain-containing protein [Rhizomicrobium sp.]|jgi:hypothetical protein|nr:DUF2807 domain-containing protein [Rhizomicrobium sp.]
MHARLGLIAVSAFAISAICLGGAFALSGGSGPGGVALNLGGLGLPACGPASSPATSRTLPWQGGDSVAVALAANSYYRPGSGDQLVIKGDPRIISHVTVRDGVVRLDCNPGLFFGHSDRVEITLPGRAFRSFEQRGSGDMQLSGLSQPEAQISIKGSGDIEAEGKIDRLSLLVAGSGDLTAKGVSDALDLDISGSGNAKLNGLTVKSADVRINGSGDATIAPRDAGHVSIIGNGSGDVEAEGSTTDLKLDMHGSGNANLGRLAARNADVNIVGSGEADVAPADKLNVGITGSGDVRLRTEPKSIDISIRGSGEVIHADGRTEDRHRGYERHAQAEDRVIRAAVRDAITADHDGSDEALDQAKSRLEARIKARVARELDRADVERNTD